MELRSIHASSPRLAIVLELDDLASAAVRQIAQRVATVARESVTSVTSVPPHVTLAACRALDGERFRPLLVELAARTPVVATTLASLGAFPGEQGVIFLAPTFSRELLELQLGILTHLQHLGAEVERYWLAGEWVPHCTLATGVSRADMPAALAHAYAALQPIAASLTRVRLVDIETPRLLYAFDLSG